MRGLYNRTSTYKPYSLRRRLFVSIVLSSVIPLLLLGFVSFYSIYSLLENRIEKGIEQNLEIERDSLEDALQHLDFTSRQLTAGVMRGYLEDYITGDTFTKYKLSGSIKSTIELVMYTNNFIETAFYFVPEDYDFLFSFYSVRKERNPLAFPLLGRDSDIVLYFAPHQPVSKNQEGMVLSVMRKVNFVSNKLEKPTYLYLETKSKVLEEILGGRQYGMKVHHLILDGQDKVLYSDDDKAYPVGSAYREAAGMLAFERPSGMGWTLVVQVEKSTVNQVINDWFKQYAAVGLFSILTSIILAWSIWRMISKPLISFKKRIQSFNPTQVNQEIQYMGIQEFDSVLDKFEHMKTRIIELLDQVEKKEIRKRHLEVEKLIHQINPHFLHNTLNTIQWIAMINGQNEIVKLVKVFSRLLHYNMGKEGNIVTVRDEIQALKDYVELQQIRYQFNFQVDIEADERALNWNLPRFLLQPLVENALYHAFGDQNGTIRVSVDLDEGGHLVILVEDNGSGIPEEKIPQLFAEQEDKTKRSGFGIGLNYVKNLIEVYYGEPYTLQVDSKVGVGTKMKIRIPTQIKG